MSGTDPDNRRQKPIDATRAWSPGSEPAPQHPPLPQNTPKIPGITLQYEIARGGMGVVYSGRQDFLDRRVAVKLLSVELGGEQFAQRFQREAKILAGIKHPNIVACHMAGTTDDGQSYLVMEFIDGPSLKKWIGDHGAISVSASLRLTRATGQALGHAFALGIIHRDVKPENILLETVTSTALDVAFPFTPKVVDLGLARASSGNAALGLTSPGSVMGTPATMSPEQYDDPDSVDYRTDIYGLGCVLYEMLVGKPAFRSRKLTEIIAQKRAPTAPDPCAENAAIPPAVGALVQSMLATNREDRPASYKELDERLAELLDALGNKSRVNKTQAPKPIVGEETVWGAGPMLRPSKAPQPPAEPAMDATMPAKPSGTRPAPSQPPAAPGTKPPGTKAPSPTAKPFQPSPDVQVGPNLLRTSELNYLAEGMDQGAAAQAPPAFQDGGSATKPPAAAPSGVAPAPAKPKTGLLVAAIVLVGGGIGAWFAFGGGGGPGKPEDPKPIVKNDPPVSTDPKPVDPPKETTPPVVANRPPVATIDGAGKSALKKTFTLEVKASDPDNDVPKFAWTVPDEVKLVSGRDQAKATFRIEDGLPNASFDITCEVSDGKTTPTKVVHAIAVDTYPGDQPLLGFEGRNEIVLDERGSGWVDARVRDGFVSCAAGKRLRTMKTSLGSERWWEWTGSLVSGPDEGTPPAKVGLRFEFGQRAWLVRCTRASDADDAEWSIEAKQATLDGTNWKEEAIASMPVKKWPQPEEDSRGYFSVQRRGDDLVVEIGSVVVPRESQREGGTEVEVPTVLGRATFKVPEGVEEPQLTLFVDQGRGEFRVRRR